MSSSRNSILFVDDDAQLIEAFARRCQQLNWEVQTAHNTLTALSRLETAPPDVLCVDVSMPSGNGLSLCELIAANEKWSGLPIIVLTGSEDEETIQRCRSLAGHYVKKGSDAWSQLAAILNTLSDTDSDRQAHSLAVRADQPHPEPGKLHLVDVVFELLGASDGDLADSSQFNQSLTESGSVADGANMSPWVLCIEDDRDFSLALKLKLEQLEIAVVRAFEGLEGVKQAMTRPADAIILDFNLPNGQGDFVLRRLKANPFTRNIPVIVLTGVKDQTLEQRMKSLGAAEFLTKPLNFDKLTDVLQQFIEIPA